MEAEAARQDPTVRPQQRDRERLALDALELGPSNVKCSRRGRFGTEARAADVPPRQRMWKVGLLSMQTRFDSRYSSSPSMPSSRPIPLSLTPPNGLSASRT